MPYVSAVHYGIPGYRTACGHMRESVSANTWEVTCEKCKGTLQWEREWFRNGVTR